MLSWTKALYVTVLCICASVVVPAPVSAAPFHDCAMLPWDVPEVHEGHGNNTCSNFDFDNIYDSYAGTCSVGCTGSFCPMGQWVSDLTCQLISTAGGGLTGRCETTGILVCGGSQYRAYRLTCTGASGMSQVPAVWAKRDQVICNNLNGASITCDCSTPQSYWDTYCSN